MTPIAFANSGTTNEDEATPVGVTLTGEDGDALPVGDQPLTFEITVFPAHGEVTVNAATGAATYTPFENYNGPDSFAFCVYDGILSEPASVAIAVAAVNDPPTANDEGYAVTPGTAIELNPIFNDEDVDGDEIEIVSVTQPTYATITLNPDGTLTADIDPDLPYGEPDPFSYTISDGNGGTDTATVELIFFHSLLAEGPPPAGGTPAAQLNQAALAPIIVEARARWEAAGIETSVLDTATFQVADLDGLELARAAVGMVLIDRDAAGFGWFVDATPGNDREFRRSRGGELVARRGSDAAGRMDLLTAVMHEMGHLMGLDHSSEPQGLMFETLEAGVRRNPDAEAIALALAADPAAVKRRARLEHLFSDQDALDEVLTLF